MDTVNSTPPKSTHAEPAGVADLERYMLNGVNEIRQILRAVAGHGELVTMYFGGNNDFVLTSVLAVTEDAVVLDCSTNDDINRRVLAGSRFIFTTTREKIKVQWNSSHIRAVAYGGKPAFCIPLPSDLLRLQRREYFRLPAPIANPLLCNVTAGKGSAKKFAFSITDISIGGMAVQGPVKEAEFEIGKCFKDCEIALPGVGNLLADVTIANIFEVTMRNGSKTTRCGCRFSNLRGKMLVLLQRYINQVERERHERMAGLT